MLAWSVKGSKNSQQDSWKIWAAFICSFLSLFQMSPKHLLAMLMLFLMLKASLARIFMYVTWFTCVVLISLESSLKNFVIFLWANVRSQKASPINLGL